MSKEIPSLPDMPKHVIHPGERYVGKGTFLVTTLLGSCVSACLWDPVARVAGMNHFLLANRRYAKDMPVSVTEAGRYGINAMELLINDMVHLGADKRRLRAKAFGGGAVLETVSKNNFTCVGSVNEHFIKEFLANEGIPLDSTDLGGELGRVIKFRTDTYAVYRRFIQKSSTFLIEKKELGYWKKTIEEHKKEEEKGGGIILFD
jgi:chemotaxis protein CheD